MRLTRGDTAMSDIVGTALLLGLTVSLVAVAAAGITSASTFEGPQVPVRLDVHAKVEAGDRLTVVHAGGSTIARDDLEVDVSVVRGWSVRLPAGGTGGWHLGERIALSVAPHEILPGDRVEILVLGGSPKRVLATSYADVPRPGGVLGESDATFGVTVTEPPSGFTVAPGSTFRLSVDVDHSWGRKAILAVSANLSEMGGAWVVPLHDDGTHGDTVAGDMRYTAYVLVPPEAVGGTSPRVTVTATDIEGRTSQVALQSGVNLQVAAIRGVSAFAPPSLNVTEPFSPTSGPPNTKVTLRGENLRTVSSVSLVDALDASNLYGATWWLPNQTAAGGEDVLYFVIPPNVPFDRDYYVEVVGATGSYTTAASNHTLRVLAPPGFAVAPPTIASFTPTEARSQAEVRVTGSGFSYATSVILANAQRTYGPTWYGASDTELVFLVPVGVLEGTYTLSISNPAGIASKPGFVVPTPPTPVITSFHPTSGIPYTEVRVNGTGFDTVVSLVLGETAVSWARLSDTEIVFYTHSGVLPGLHPIRIASQTVGNVQGPIPFQALEAPPPPEEHVYSSALASQVAHGVTKWAGQPPDRVSAYLKVNVTQSTILGENNARYVLSHASFHYIRFKPGDDGVVTFTSVCPAILDTTQPKVYLFKMDNMTIPQYNRDHDTLRYYFSLAWKKQGGGSSEFFTSEIDSTAIDQHFSLRKNDGERILYDAGWETDVRSCGP